MQTTTLPEGWGLKGSHPDDYEAGITPDAIDGKAAAYLRARVASSGFGTIMQQFKADAYRGQRLRLAALVRSEGVERWAGLWMRVDGPGRHSLAFDNMQNRGITGTTDWTPYNVVLDVETLSLTELDEVEQWLRGELKPAVRGKKNPGTAVSRGVRTLMIRLLGGEKRRYEARSGAFKP